MAEAFPILSPKEEELVFLDGSTDVIAEVVVAELVLGDGEKVAGVELVIAEILEDGAVEMVGAVAGDDVEGDSGSASPFGGHVGGLHLHFRNEVGVDVVHQAAVGAGDKIESSIDGEVLRVGAVAVDGLIGRREGRGHRELIGVGDDRAGYEGDEVDVIVAVERELVDLLGVNDAGEVAGDGVESFADLGGDVHGDGDVADLEFEVGCGATVGDDGDAGLLLALEAGLGDVDVIGSDGEVGDDIEAIGICLGEPSVLRVGVADGDFGGGDDGSGQVGDGAGDAAEAGLGLGGGDEDEGGQQGGF